VLRNPPAVARLILDSKQSDEVRQTAVLANPQFAAGLIEEMTRDLAPGSPEEYARIPWIWRVAIACGRRNDASQIKAVLAASLPKDGEPLRDWQAVVVGGGIVNGISQRGVWPARHIDEILNSDPVLLQRWSRALDLSAAMAENEKIPPGTRYDALRMIALQGWEKGGQQLLKYLAPGTNAELQMGAVSGLADIPTPEAEAALRSALKHLEGQNRALALEALKSRKFTGD
jgi:HEAT repeat protein